MIDFRKILAFYKNPFQSTKEFLLEKEDREWLYPILIYLISFAVAIIAFFTVKFFNNKMDGMFRIFFYFPIFTLPVILVYSLTGTIFFREFRKNIVSHFYYSILTISYGFLIGFPAVIIGAAMLFTKEISPSRIGWIYYLAILTVRLIFNVKIFDSKKKQLIWLKSFAELTFTIVIFALIGLLITFGYKIINAP